MWETFFPLPLPHHCHCRHRSYWWVVAACPLYFLVIIVLHLPSLPHPPFFPLPLYTSNFYYQYLTPRPLASSPPTLHSPPFILLLSTSNPTLFPSPPLSSFLLPLPFSCKSSPKSNHESKVELIKVFFYFVVCYILLVSIFYLSLRNVIIIDVNY